MLSAGFLLAVDYFVINVALPEIGRDVGIGVAGLQWIITAFALPAAGLGLLFGRLGDIVGRRLLFLTGIALLGDGSVMGGVADTAWFLIVGRVVQGLGAAAVAPTALSLLTTSFEEGPRRARALDINGALISAGFTNGALLGGLLTAGLSWRATFLINMPIAIVVLILTRTACLSTGRSVRVVRGTRGGPQKTTPGYDEAPVRNLLSPGLLRRADRI